MIRATWSEGEIRSGKPSWGHSEAQNRRVGVIFWRCGAAMTETINGHPLLFTLQDAVSGRGFLAGITVHGSALMQLEDDKWWMYGVSPGAIAESGATPEEAFLHFRNRYKEVLFDIAGECSDFATFEAEVRGFFDAVDEEEKRHWDKALELVRANPLATPPQFKTFPRKTADDHPATIKVERLESKHRKFKPTDNVQDTLSKAA